jgi:hypothetical protein
VLGTETFLEALISFLSQHRSFETWTGNNNSGVVSLADNFRGLVMEHLKIMFKEKSDLIPKFKELNGFQIVLDLLSYSSSELLKEEVLWLLCFPGVLEKYGALLSRLGLMELLNKISKESKKETIRNTALYMMPVLANKNPRRSDKASMPVDVLEEALASVLSSTLSIAKKEQALMTLVGMIIIPANQDFLLKHLTDGAIQAVFQQLLPLTKDVVQDFDSYPIHPISDASLYTRYDYAETLCNFIRMVIDALTIREKRLNASIINSYSYPPGIAIKLTDMLLWDKDGELGKYLNIML